MNRRDIIKASLAVPFALALPRLRSEQTYFGIDFASSPDMIVALKAHWNGSTWVTDYIDYERFYLAPTGISGASDER